MPDPANVNESPSGLEDWREYDTVIVVLVDDDESAAAAVAELRAALSAPEGS